MADSRLEQQLAFLLEADKLKNVLRRTALADSSRRENSAEHSWHLVLSAAILREHAGDVNLVRVLEMLAIHDLVEIDAGDTFAYDKVHLETKTAREHAAAARIFGLLPSDQQVYLRALWDEFEADETREAQFANALDRIQALWQNVACDGGTWRTYNLTRDAVLERMAPVKRSLPNLWPSVLEAVERYKAKGVLR
jgi:putative hydrolase of HD superfamily